MMKTTLLTIEDIHRVVQQIGVNALMEHMIDALEGAFRAYDPAHIAVPARSGFAYDEPFSGLLEWMPVMKRGTSATIKVVGYHPHNPAYHELPTIISSIGVYDVRTGHLTGLMDGTFLTALRTGAVSAIASSILARKDSRVVGIIGNGAQAVTQLHALSTRFDIERVLIYDVDPAVSRSFVHRTAFLGLPVTIVPAHQLSTLVTEADILCTVTSTPVGMPPVFKDGEVKSWLHVNAVGSDFPGKCEVPLSLLERAFVCPDFPEQARAEGECQQLEPHQIGPALHELVKDPDTYAEKRDGITVFDSTGWALADGVAAQMMLDLARQYGLGRDLAIQHMPADPMNPYDFSH